MGYTNVPDRDLLMLPTDLALKTDPVFRPMVEEYAADEALFFKDFAAAFAKLLSLGCPKAACPFATTAAAPDASVDKASEFREAAMHGHTEVLREMAANGANVNGVETSSGRTALHK